MAQALQIISTETSEGNFVLRQENLDSIISKVPDNTKVAVISVVGAFRTGKSFLLNFFLRYLRSNVEDSSETWMISEGDELAEGNMNDWNIVQKDGAEKAESKPQSFAWRGGQERQTTGIWMWSEPFLRTDSSGQQIAVLLMDTQGMFDNETTMSLTAQIFGLSTLVSSFQIYNVDKRIQEDNLQHLALFSEYGRMALLPKEQQNLPVPPSAADIRPILPPTAEEEEEKEKENSSEAVAEKEKSKELPQEVQQKEVPKPFQRLQFLVRDWQNFDTEYDPEETPELDDATYSKLKGEMSKYLNDVLRERGDKSDLQSTREQITRCFDTLDCYIFPHPGFAVTKKNYDGSIKKIEPFFRALMNRYVRYVFDKELQPKVINSRKITGMELKTYFEVYVKMFQVGETSFPKAMTMLDATAEANNRNAYDLAMNHFKAGMNDVAGVDKSFVPETQLRKRCNELKAECVQMFDGIATMGSESAIARMKTQLLEAIAADEERYLTTNSLRNPYKDIEFYIIPLGIAAVAWFLARVVDATCSTDFCEATEDTFVRVYMFIFFILTALMWKRIRGIYYYIKELIPLLIKTSSNADGPNAANIMEAMVEARNKVRNIQEQKLQQKLEREKKDKEEAEKKCKASAVAAAKDNIAKKSD